MTSMTQFLRPAHAFGQVGVNLGSSFLRTWRATREVWIETFELQQAARRRWPFLEWGH